MEDKTIFELTAFFHATMYQNVAMVFNHLLFGKQVCQAGYKSECTILSSWTTRWLISWALFWCAMAANSRNMVSRDYIWQENGSGVELWFSEFETQICCDELTKDSGLRISRTHPPQLWCKQRLCATRIHACRPRVNLQMGNGFHYNCRGLSCVSMLLFWINFDAKLICINNFHSPQFRYSEHILSSSVNTFDSGASFPVIFPADGVM